MGVVEEKPARGGNAPEPASRASSVDRSGGVVLWALGGAGWIAFAGQAWIRWFASPELFKPAPILGPDRFSTGLLISLRAIEGISLLILVLTLWFYLIKPWRRTGRLQLDGMIVIGGLLASAIDPLINYFHYTFAWNAHALNMGDWLSFFPNHSGPDRYGEGLAWYIPQYLYLGIGLASVECWIIGRLRARHPRISNVLAFALAALAVFAIDLIIEQLFIRTKVYAFPRTWRAITLWPGKEYQFPLNESVSVAIYSAGFTALRMSAFDSGDGLSFVQRGVGRLIPRLRTVISTVAVIGFCALWAAVAYFLPWSWLSVNANSINHHIPSYMTPGPSPPPG